jgi:tetratricopeptide (TPR) repeat protein
MTAQDTEKQTFDAQYQTAVKNYELAVRAFHRQNYDKAKEIFEKLAGGEIRDVADRARVHLRLCLQRLSRPAPSPKTAEDYYTLGVGALNARRPREAVEYLSKAHRLEPEREHIRYALAAGYARQGDAVAALDHLRAAIRLHPANRIQARKDEDFRGLAADRRFRDLLKRS